MIQNPEVSEVSLHRFSYKKMYLTNVYNKFMYAEVQFQ